MRKPLIIFVLVALFIGFSCDTEEPDGIFDPNTTAAPDPVITSVTPPDSAYGAADTRSTVTIVGENFGDNADEVIVNFGSKKATIISHSATQMVVTPPANFTDSLRVMVSKYGSNAAYEFGVYEDASGEFHPYKLLNPISEIAGFDAYKLPQSVCVDNAGNVFSTHDRVIEKVSPDGIITNVGELRGKTTTRLLVGPDGALYYTYSKNIMKVDTVTYSQHTYKKLNESSLDMAFDVNDNLYAIDAHNIYSVDASTMEPTELMTFNADFPDTTLITMRIYNNDLYLAGNISYQTGEVKRYVWKVALDVTTGTLNGDISEVFDWSESEDYDDINITNITFDSNGVMLVGSSNHAIVQIDPAGGAYSTGSVTKMYADLLGDKYIHRFFWGPDNYLYISTYNISDTENARLLKVNMFGTGAPYYGRN